MCQLTFIHTLDDAQHIQVARKLALSGLYCNTHTRHQDGCGMFSIKGNGQYNAVQSPHTPHLITNMSEVFGSFTRTPVMLHVRLSTVKDTAGKEEFSHPFQTDRLSFAHNGTLEFKQKTLRDTVEKDYPNMIDSQVFLQVLTEELNVEDNLVKALQNTMEKFAGKFAFLIYDKKYKDWYITRGTTALLHKVDILSHGQKIGTLVNTELGSLIESTNVMESLLQLDYPHMKYSFSEPELLEEEKIYKLDINTGNLVVVGDIKENTKVYTTYTTTKTKNDDDWYSSRYGYGGYDYYSHLEERENEKEVSYIRGGKSIASIIVSFMAKYQITLEEMDNLVYIVLGTGILGITLQDFKMFYESTIKPINEYFSSKEGEIKKDARVKLIKKLNKRIKTLMYPIELYEHNPELEFPLILNEEEVLHDLEVKYRKLVDKKGANNVCSVV